MLTHTGTRSTASAVTFTKPFRLGRGGQELPAGMYTFHTVEDVYEGEFEPVYRTIRIDFEVSEGRATVTRFVRPDDFADALALDGAR